MKIYFESIFFNSTYHFFMYRKYWKPDSEHFPGHKDTFFTLILTFSVKRTWNGPLTLSISFLSLKMTIFSSTRLQIWTSFFCHDAVIKAWLNLAITDSKIDIFLRLSQQLCWQPFAHLAWNCCRILWIFKELNLS